MSWDQRWESRTILRWKEISIFRFKSRGGRCVTCCGRRQRFFQLHFLFKCAPFKSWPFAIYARALFTCKGGWVCNQKSFSRSEDKPSGFSVRTALCNFDSFKREVSRLLRVRSFAFFDPAVIFIWCNHPVIFTALAVHGVNLSEKRSCDCQMLHESCLLI